MRYLLLLSVVVSMLFAACGSSDDSNNAVTPPETNDNSVDALLESSSSLGLKENENVFISSNSDVIMSSSSVEVSSVIPPESVVKGVMTDARDGRTYNTVKIGEQVWMAENLDYEVENSYCFNNSPDSCKKYGRLYKWAASVGGSEEDCGFGKHCKLLLSTVRGVCPEGWHLPSREEWKTLYSAMGNNPYAMKATGWPNWPDATDAYGFSALPAGYYGELTPTCETRFCRFGRDAVFWSSTEDNGMYTDGHYAYCLFIFGNETNLPSNFKNNGYSVRCVQDLIPQESVTKGTMTDSRDGKTYKTVKIGDQVWMTENLNYEVENSYCYNNSADSCAKYGRLYKWAASVGKSEEDCGYGKNCGLFGSVRGVCPEGWHLPSREEWKTLYSVVEENVFAMQAKGWQEWPYATDAFGFSALPVAGDNSIGFDYVGSYAYFWSSMESNSYNAYGWGLGMDYASSEVESKNSGLVVRCIQDSYL